ncbi:MAG: MarR family winged helix-turn-helix transcriptional regulator [Dehalococcoidia bacterium]
MQASRGIEEVLQLLNLGHQLRQDLTRLAREHTGLNLERITILHGLAQNNGEVTVSELALYVFRTTHAASTIVNGMERDGLVFRQREPGFDRRQVLVQITPLGTAKLQTFLDVWTLPINAILAHSFDDVLIQRLRQAITILNEVLR